jgi:hypothetical protein
MFPIYKKTGVPQFQLGMKFRSKKHFKKAIIRYVLSDRRVINFIKDDTKRVRAKCDSQYYPWVCLLSKNSRSESWQIVTFEAYHTCPPRRDNRLVIARKIAEKYENFIIANPSWSFVSMKQTVQEEMFADVNVSKLKRAKGMVMQKAMDAMKGQYQRLYEYQLELLRSNPGSTVIVHKEKDVEPPTFYRMYICLDALKKGFIAGCRRVVGWDGYFFKGAIIGELLCAIGRDANNQMYPIAWAVVDPMLFLCCQTTATARVATAPGGQASVQLVANVPRPHAYSSATINITSGKASAKVSTSAPNLKKSKTNLQNPSPVHLLPPWATDVTPRVFAQW